MYLSIIVPVYNEASTIVQQLNQLSQQLSIPLASHRVEIIVVDGNSSDNTVELTRSFFGVRLVSASPGRAAQMNKGAKLACGRYLLFLHADTQLPNNAFTLIDSKSTWGFFTVKLSGDNYFFRVIEAFINWRTQLTFSAGGDQAIFIDRQLFIAEGGFTIIPLMEDIELSNRLKKIDKPLIIKQPVITSSRRWQEQGIIKTILLMWALKFCYYCGVAPSRLKKLYANQR